MSEDMPNRISNRMPNRMPEDLPNRMSDGMKLNAMVGITRSKVTFNVFYNGYQQLVEMSMANLRYPADDPNDTKRLQD